MWLSKIAKNKNFSQIIKSKLKENKVVQRIFKRFNLDLNRIDEMNIILTDLDGRYAETDADNMKINQNLINTKNIDEIYAIVLHEIWHFAKRSHEQESGYFGDDEEIEAFSVSIAALLAAGHDLNSVYNLLYPKVEFHFHNPQRAKEVFQLMIEKAEQL